MVDPKIVQVTVKVTFGHAVREGDTVDTLSVGLAADGSDSVYDLKEKIAETLGGKLTAEDLFLTFGPNERKLGKQYLGDPTVDEKKLLMSSFSILAWLQRVAIQRAAASAEHKDPDTAVADARAKGEIPKIADLPAPWGPKPFIAAPDAELTTAGYLPAKYPENSSPLVYL